MAWGSSNIGGKSPKAESYDIVLLTSGWTADTTYADYGFRYKYVISGITDKSVASMVFDANSVNPASEAGVLSATQTAEDCIYFYSESVPESNLTGVAIISEDVPVQEIGAGFDPNNYVKTSSIGAPSGVAGLDGRGRVLTSQLPPMDYVPTSKVGVASGVASLGADGKIPASQLPEIGSTGGHVVSGTAPDNTGLLWVDTASGGVLKYHNGTSWTVVASAWG